MSLTNKQKLADVEAALDNRVRCQACNARHSSVKITHLHTSYAYYVCESCSRHYVAFPTAYKVEDMDS